jgi:hypothetical protein
VTIQFSRNLSVLIGVLTPLLETVRRWKTWQENLSIFLDDYLLGAFLLYGAWRVSKYVRDRQRMLAAAWVPFMG